MRERRPSDASIDALFDGARRARILAGPGHPGGALLDVEAQDLPALRDALRIVESDEQLRCMCRGDLVVELRGRFFSTGTISFHHGVSVRLVSWGSDARLVDGPALLRFLAERGVDDPLRAHERGLAEGRAQASAREAWIAAAPSAIRAALAHLEKDPLGLPRSLEPKELDEVLARVRGDLDDPDDPDDRAVARALLAWLAVGRGPWSGYASYEELPIRLLERLPIAAVLAVATREDLDDATIAAAARFFGNHQLVTFRKSALAAVPDAFFARARPLLRIDDDRARHDHAARVAKGARRPRGAPYPIGDGVEVLGESSDGPLSGLAVAGDALVSADVRTVVRFEPGSVAAVPIADARDHFVWLSRGAPIAWATGRLGEVATERGTIARGEDGPVEIASSERGVAWIARHGQNGRAVRAVAAGDETVRTLAEGDLLWCLAVAGDRAFFVEAGWRHDGTLRAAPLAGGKVERVAKVPVLTSSMGTPRYVLEGGEILLAIGDHVTAVDPGGRPRRLIEAKTPIHAIAADAAHVALLVGDERRWSIAVAPRSGGSARIAATFERAPYHRHPLVIARGRACTLLGDRVIAAKLDA